ncbi:ABC transporter ATP-binding protein [Mesorhizobium sp. NZP2077]|uniref:ABC transporter ATP-binding protein n=1 Tax=Mesorhizobium sp. NZP2077 TaxID=2483404 RepID=UPI001556D29B|nr:ABC transporter ATP-binding protein [Mesorhizobium sp. NZP2077]QKC86827.1 ABC transporter ATP-binding protein [Mesorhizobium sp. NZP2077]QKD20533.1 ABC transporter ATP-binding protein [Mesorhizobium sp. NZP2077]
MLEVRNLNVTFRGGGRETRVVKDLNFSVPDHSTVAIVGESGSGKSVTAMSILGLVSRVNGKVTGSITLDGRELVGLNESELSDIRGKDISMIFQEPMTSLNPVMTIGRQVGEVLRRHRGMDAAEAEAEALRLLNQVQIPNAKARLSDYPHLFSGGMRQRVMIAMALACKPRLLIADEPTTALDVTIQSQILGLIEQLQAEVGMSVLFITHDMGVVAEIASRAVVMKDGEKVEEADVRTLFSAPAHPYTRRLLYAVPVLGSMTGVPLPKKFATLETSSATPVPATTKQRVQATVVSREPLLDVRNLCTKFSIRGGLMHGVAGHIHAVENVSLSLERGETLSLVGESGSGKSTTGRSILRLVEPQSGSVVLDGEDVSAADPSSLRRLRRQMQMIFQDPYSSLNPKKMVGAAIAEPMIVHGIAKGNEAMDRSVALLEKVGLTAEHAYRYPHEFSGGQRQRICIARALSTSPKLIIADEAVSALDVSIRAQVVNLMMDLQQELGLSYIFISHDIAVVERISHRVAVMCRGRVVEYGPRQAVFENPQHPYTKKLMQAVPIPDPDHPRIRSAAPEDSLKSSIHPVGYVPPDVAFSEVTPGHLIQVGEL